MTNVTLRFLGKCEGTVEDPYSMYFPVEWGVKELEIDEFPKRQL